MSNNERRLAYEAQLPVSVWAVGVFWVAIAAAVGFVLVVPAVVVWVMALVVRHGVGQTVGVRGYGYAQAAVWISGGAALLGLAALVLMPTVDREGRLSQRSVCAANLRGIAQSMNVYAADNGEWYPLVPFAPYMPVSNAAKGTVVAPTADAALATLYAGSSAQAGSVQANLWILTLTGQVAPKQYICREDPFWEGDGGSDTDTKGRFYDNFPSGKQLSYSAAYPWNADGTPSPMWKNATDASLPLIADMAPLQNTGDPARNLTPAAAPANPRTWNSGNHKGDGQNVAYGDSHAEFSRTPAVGQDNDNIYTMSAVPSKGPAQFGGIPAGYAIPALTAEKVSYDVIMLPVRNETTGKM